MIFGWLVLQTRHCRRMDRRVCVNFTVIVLGTILFLTTFQLNLSTSNLHFDYDNMIPAYTLNTVNSTYTYPKNVLSPEDYTTLIDLHDFQFTIMSNCSDSTFLLILIHSAVEHVIKRNAIRETWGSQVNKNIKLFFVVAKVKEQYFQYQLEKEHQMYKDILQGNFVDVYKNMTYKHTMSLKFPIYHCPQATYILKIDDDIYINLPMLLNFLNTELSPFGARNLLLCNAMYNSFVKRSFRSKWRVSYQEYYDTYYPPHCVGWICLYSQDVLFTLYKAVQKSKYFWIDDVHITGVIAKQENIRHTSIKSLTRFWVNLYNILNHSYDNGSFVVAGPDLSVNIIYTLWNFLQNCTTSDCPHPL